MSKATYPGVRPVLLEQLTRESPRQEDLVSALRWTLGYWVGEWFLKYSCTLLAEWGLIPITFTT